VDTARNSEVQLSSPHNIIYFNFFISDHFWSIISFISKKIQPQTTTMLPSLSPSLQPMAVFSGEPGLVDYAPAFSSTLSWTTFSLVTCGTGLQTRCPFWQPTNSVKVPTPITQWPHLSLIHCWTLQGKEYCSFYAGSQKSGSISEVFPKLNVSYMYYMQIN